MPAREYKFTLDPFQQVSIHAIQRNESVLVILAHTSAGKTVVAEYAIAKALQNKQRVIYTSPIKVGIEANFASHASNPTLFRLSVTKNIARWKLNLGTSG